MILRGLQNQRFVNNYLGAVKMRIHPVPADIWYIPTDRIPMTTTSSKWFRTV